MPSDKSEDSAFAVVLCTADGAVTLDGAEFLHPLGKAPKPDPGKTSHHDSPCAFAGQATAAPPPSLQSTPAATFIVHVSEPRLAAPDVAPGRGLAGPPPPARGPPSILLS